MWLLLLIIPATLALIWRHGHDMHECGRKLGLLEGRQQEQERRRAEIAQAQEAAIQAYERNRPRLVLVKR